VPKNNPRAEQSARNQPVTLSKAQKRRAEGPKSRPKAASYEPARRKAVSPDIRVRLGERIRKLRVRRGWSQEDLAAHSGIGRPFLSNVENGRREPGLRSLQDLAETFGLSISQLMRGL
jgi:ribosome-binding protein aMBF1 (putative translation factor)